MAARARGFAHLGVLALVFVVAIIIAGGVVVFRTNQRMTASNQGESSQTDGNSDNSNKVAADAETVDTARTDKDLILKALDGYCKDDYKKFWEATYAKSIDPTTVTSGYDDSVPNPLMIEGDRALVQAAKCDTTQLTEQQKFAPFALYLTKDNAAWKPYERFQSTPPCSEFDGGKWPADMVPECVDGSAVRLPKQ